MLVLQDLHAAAPGQLRSKSSDEATRDYCWSALVLSAAFGFRVAPGNTYSLYFTRRTLESVLNCARGMGPPCARRFRCAVPIAARYDLGAHFDEAVREGSPVHDALLQYLDGIHEQLRESGSWEALLRQGERQLPYQQRVLTTALASSCVNL